MRTRPKLTSLKKTFGIQLTFYSIRGNTSPQGLIMTATKEKKNPKITALRIPKSYDCEGYSPRRTSHKE